MPDIQFVCQYCGKDTSNIEYDYLTGTDHLTCALESEQNMTLGTPNPDRRLLLVEVSLIEHLSNDQELGAKVRQLYYEAYNNS